MKKCLYCIDKSCRRKLKLPFSFDKTSNIKDAYQKDYPLVVFDESFLKKRKKLNSQHLKNKVCLIHFLKKNKNNLKIVKSFDFFDYFTDEDIKDDISFKINKARSQWRLKNQINSLGNKIQIKDKTIEEITLIDPLTECYNWRYFLQRAHQELSRSRRHLHKVSFIAIDIDHFRRINEIYGIRVADAVIKEIVAIIKDNLRKEDILVRWRGDEFFVIVPHAESEAAEKVARRIRDKISLNKFRYKDLVLNVKASVGVVSSPQDNVFNERDVVSALGTCLIQAKRKGGNTVSFYSLRQPQGVVEKKKKASIYELRGKIEKMNVLLTRDLLEMIYGFARAIEAKDFYTGRHVESTARIAEEIAKSLNLPKKEVENIKNSAVLHDLGKVGIEGRILSKKCKLTVKERAAIQTHPSIAAEILREIHALRGAIPAILYHHERFDGKGYPLGLKGGEIPLSARIVAIADVYQALISDRPYRRAYSKKKALEIMKKESGKHFDPQIVKIFLEIIARVNGEK